MSKDPIRRFGYSNMFVTPEADPRGGLDCHDERSALHSYLTDYRLTLELKCAGLDAEAMARRSVPPSTLSLLGLVRHLADVERYWFRQVLADEEDASARYSTRDDPDGAFDGALGDPEAAAEAWAAWREDVAFSERFLAGASDLGAVGRYKRRGEEGEINLRVVLVHMLEEYARHCGHADLLRERIDGRVGQ